MGKLGVSVSEQVQTRATKTSMPTFSRMNSVMLQRKCACGGTPGPTGECENCRKKREAKEQTLQRVAVNAEPVSQVPPIVYDVLQSPGQPLDRETRARLEPHFGRDFSRVKTNISPTLSLGAENDGYEQEANAVAERATTTPPATENHYDFSNVRVHTDARAAASARAVNALAYTVGHEVVFGAGQYQPQSQVGKHLIAHELTHVVQQGENKMGVIQRQGMGDFRLSEACNEMLATIRATPAFTTLDAPGKTLTEDIITEIRKKTWPEQYRLFAKLEALFKTPVKAAADISKETQVSTVQAAKQEKVRVAKPAAAKKTNLEETAAKDPKRTWTAIKGKFGGGTYHVDRTSATNIVVKAKIHLTATGTGTQKDIDAIKSMEDGIEKAASTKGYLVDIEFVEVADANTFEVEVNPSKWEVATNWSGGDPTGFAHELHHMFAFELDRYNYIEAHAENQSMEIPDRLHWFREELKKPANYNDPTSIMNSASHPNDDDACRVAGLDLKTCMDERKKAAKP